MRPLDYQLTYAGKASGNEIIHGPSAETRIRFSAVAGPVAKPNRLFHGENLAILRSLMEDPEVCHRIKLVYIDPPFATGAVFESRNGQHAYSDLAYGWRYLEFLRERLIVLRELMATTASIYVHLDAKMAFAAKVIMDEVFGPANFRNWITRKKSNNKNYTHKQYGNIADYILFYSKSSQYVWNRPFDPWCDKSPAKEYQYVEENSGRRFMKVPVHAPASAPAKRARPGAAGYRLPESTGSTLRPSSTSSTRRARSIGRRMGILAAKSTSTRVPESRHRTYGSASGTHIIRTSRSRATRPRSHSLCCAGSLKHPLTPATSCWTVSVVPGPRWWPRKNSAEAGLGLIRAWKRSIRP